MSLGEKGIERVRASDEYSDTSDVNDSGAGEVRRGNADILL